MTANSLGLAGDGDEIDLAVGIERAFGFELSVPEGESLLTVGDLYDCVLKHLPPDGRDRKCASAMAFYRLRRCAERLGLGHQLRPSSALTFLRGGRPKRTIKSLALESGLAIDGIIEMTWAGSLGCILLPFLTVAVSVTVALNTGTGVLGAALMGVLVAIPMGIVLAALDPGVLPDDCRTMGDLARQAVPQNFGYLARLGARHSAEDVWQALLAIVARHSETDDKIGRETYILIQ
jgi:hypothetical protein